MAKLVKIDDDEYAIIDNGEENFHHVRLTSLSKYPDIVFQYGRVQLLEENDSLRVKYEYEVFSNPMSLNTNSFEFQDYIGQILMGNLEEILIYNKHKEGKR